MGKVYLHNPMPNKKRYGKIKPTEIQSFLINLTEPDVHILKSLQKRQEKNLCGNP